ncbi:wd repeat domain-containing protein [Ophiostoma piceae UAMH 11346]|uniref:Wd repeat domain-containing protein n=1 Tax=Ophiostoma piceae (strain UAMH 11346) TaxID=1262450 RepID=S3CZL5_OPHP1|nr:wd repeat domain-containing protein [Ophiostoma piceae UAMH 11346]
MAAMLGAIKSGQDRLSRDVSKDLSKNRGNSPIPASPQTPRSVTPATNAVRDPASSPSTSSVIITSPSNGAPVSDISTPRSSRHQPQASTNTIIGPRTPTSADGHARPATPSSSSAPTHFVDSAAGASSPPSNGTPTQPLAIRKTQRLSRGTPAAVRDSESALSPQAALGTSVQSSSPSINNSSIDPLSQHIFLRTTNTDASKTSKARFPPGPDSSNPDASSPVPDSPIRFSSPIADVGKEKKKGFLGRLSMRASKKKEDASDHASESGEPRLEGSNAHVFSSIVNSAGYIPHHKEPPRYIKIKQHNKKTREFDRMFLAQELIGTRPPETPSDSRVPIVTVTTSNQGRMKTATGGAIWTTEFSKDGKYMAAGGRDHIVRIWQVISTAEDRRAQEEEEAHNGGGEGERLSAPVFLEKPVREFVGHTGEILDISWSKNNFLLSTSMDKTVRLWHISRDECLCTFKHKELVSKVAFHPKDDRFFLAGCLDATLRLWSIPDKAIAYSAQLSDMITAVAFSPDGKMAIAGLLNGFCYLLETEGLKPLTNIHVRSSRGRNAKGSKITGIVSMELPETKPPESVILVTSTDARVRIYNLKDKTVDCKFKGHEHASGQLSASFSDDGKYVICGSESKKVFIWSISPSDSITKDRYPCESFDAHREMVTTAVFAPTKTRQLLGASGDPIYDLCNPPPITLMSLEETMASQSGRSNNTLHTDNPPSSSPPRTTQPTHQPTRAKPEESPAYIARSTHYDGNIIVTTDDAGVIKVFRQDCAAVKRRHESWETGSFSRKLGATSGLVGRSGSIITRTSASSAAHSRRGSLSQPGSHLGSAVGTPQMGADRINSWRHGIESGSSRPNSLVGSGIVPSRTERSISPSKSSRTPLSALASDARRFPYAATTSSPLSPHFAVNHGRANPPGSPSAATPATARLTDQPISASASMPTISTTNHDGPSIVDDRASTADSHATHDAHDAPTGTHSSESDAHNAHGDGDAEPRRSMEPSMAFKSEAGEDTLRLDPAGASYGFWNLNRWKNISLRPSFITGVVSGAMGGSQEPSSPVESTGSQNDGDDKSEKGEKGDKSEASTNNAATTPNPKSHRSRLSFGVNNILPKSPLGRSSETAEEGGSKHSRAKSTATIGGRPGQLLTPTITVADDNGPVDPTRSQPLSRSHSPYTRNGSIISYLSSEMTSTDGDAEGDLGAGADGDEMRCTKCGAHEFKGRLVNGVQKLECSRCGKMVD